MKQLSNWGFSPASWKGEHGEYWVLMQGLLMVGYLLLPVYRPNWLAIAPPLLYGIWGLSALIFLLSSMFLIKGVIDLGANLTPLPYPKPDAELVQTGIYQVVRHPLYTGVVLAAKAYAIGQLSLSHLAAMLVLLVFFNLKADREEQWLSQRFADYADYRQRVKKLIPGLF